MLNRHVSINECANHSSISLCGSSAAAFLLLDQQSGNDHEVIRKDGRANKQFESLAPLREATFHPTAAKQHGDAPLEMRPSIPARKR